MGRCLYERDVVDGNGWFEASGQDEKGGVSRPPIEKWSQASDHLLVVLAKQ